jgi:predicted O-linked N-acetylglucosamine transferase (SPINDLY family)
MVQQDEIDILVDLTGHTGGNRLDIFALKVRGRSARRIFLPAAV